MTESIKDHVARKSLEALNSGVIPIHEPGIKVNTICSLTQLSRNQVKWALEKLVKEGRLTKKGGGGRQPAYFDLPYKRRQIQLVDSRRLAKREELTENQILYISQEKRILQKQLRDLGRKLKEINQLLQAG